VGKRGEKEEGKKLRRLEGGMNSFARMDDLDGWMNSLAEGPCGISRREPYSTGQR